MPSSGSFAVPISDFSEAFLYFYRNRERFAAWQAVVIYPSRSSWQSDIRPYRALLDSEKVYRIYLDELGEMSQLPVEVALMLLTTVNETQAPEAARELEQVGEDLLDFVEGEDLL